MSDTSTRAARRYALQTATTALKLAAELQAASANKHPAEGEGGTAEAAGYELRELQEVAVEAGIEPRFVEAALARIEAGGDRTPAKAASSNVGVRKRWLGTDDDHLEVSLRVQGDCATVWSLLRRSFEQPTVGLRLRQVVGANPVEGGTAVFRMLGLSQMAAERGTYSSLCYAMEVIEARQIEVTLRPCGEQTEVTVRSDLTQGARKNVKWGRGCGGLMGLTFGGGGLALGWAMGALAATGIGALGVLLGFGGTAAAWRWAYRRSLHRTRAELSALLHDVEMQRYREPELPAESAELPSIVAPSTPCELRPAALA